MRRRALSLGLAAVALAAAPLDVVAHERDLVTARGTVGPIQTGETTIRDMRRMFGDPASRAVVRVGCSRVIKLRWKNQLQTYTYKADDERRVIDARVLARHVDAKDEDDAFSFHTRKGLRVGDRESKLRKLYPEKTGDRHKGHTHYLLRESKYGTRLIAKVVDRRVAQLEAAPYEYC